MDGPPPISGDKMATSGDLAEPRSILDIHGPPGLHLKIPSALDVGLGSISAWRCFVVPTTILVFVRNARSFSWNDLLLRCAICRFASQVVGREGFGEHPIDLIGPTTIMFDNLIGNLSHVSLLMLGGLIADVDCVDTGMVILLANWLGC
jgi:hypothetical protein